MHLNDSVLAAGHLEDAVFILFITFFIVLNNYWLLQTRFCGDVSEILNECKEKKKTVYSLKNDNGGKKITFISPIRVLLCVK